MTTPDYHLNLDGMKLRMLVERTAALTDYVGVKASFYNAETGELDQAFHVGISGQNHKVALLNPEYWNDSQDFPALMDFAARYIRLAKFYGTVVEEYRGYQEPSIFLVDPQKFVEHRADFVSVPDKATLDRLLKELLN